MRLHLSQAVFGAVALGALYRRFLREPVLTWGATAEEAAARLPGDELLEDADGVATRAVEIDAPAAAVWPWIAQMGPSPRGGAYTYDWIENLLGLKTHSADRVLPDFQHPQVGETLGYGPNLMRVERVEPEPLFLNRIPALCRSRPCLANSPEQPPRYPLSNLHSWSKLA